MPDFANPEDFLNAPMFDAYTRRAAASMTRRGTLAALAGTGLTAALGGRLPVAAKKKKKKGKGNLFTRCAGEVRQCQDVIPDLGATPEQILCCKTLARCHMSEHLNCLLAAQP